MNAEHTFTNSIQHKLVVVLLATLLTLLAMLGQQTIGQLAGVELQSTAHACQSHVGGC